MDNKDLSISIVFYSIAFYYIIFYMKALGFAPLAERRGAIHTHGTRPERDALCPLHGLSQSLLTASHHTPVTA